MKYRVTIDVLDAEGVCDPCGKVLTFDTWRPAFYQQFQNDQLDNVVAAVAVAVNSVVNPK